MVDPPAGERDAMEALRLSANQAAVSLNFSIQFSPSALESALNVTSSSEGLDAGPDLTRVNLQRVLWSGHDLGRRWQLINKAQRRR